MRLVITVCPREPGIVALPLEHGRPIRRWTASAIVRALTALIAERRLTGRVRVQEGCAGGCSGRGPNVGVTMYPLPAPGERQDNVAVGWRTYVGSISGLDCLAAIIDENLSAPCSPRPRKRAAP
jgi:hypothetical protein